ncbi:hypothetical protein BDV40DRAFT_264716 [Aspergillus tamarii]|uniref:Uncharacterized protein n=1 Tax=Aspergillus tamarii TaxID=41984 RepID=A0A5N6UVC8_ASPTM|nr:hypothetical protein BDV40DRAFT_264716 [Aspergillus tamarii]
MRKKGEQLIVGKRNSMFSDGWKSEILSMKTPPWLYILKGPGNNWKFARSGRHDRARGY